MRFVDFVSKSFRALTLHDYAGIACRKTSMLAIVSQMKHAGSLAVRFATM